MPGPVDDNWTGADGSAWNSSVWTTIRNVRGASAAPTIQFGTGRMVTSSPTNNCRIIAAPADTFGDVNIVVSMRTTIADTVEIGFRVGANVASGADPDSGYILSIKPLAHPTPTTDIGIVRFNKINSYDFVAQASDVPHNDGVFRRYRIHSRGTRHRAKWWLASDPEPPLWKIDVVDATYSTGRIFLGIWNNDDDVTPAVADWDEFHAEEVLPPPPGIRIAEELLDALYIGEEPVVAAYRGETSIVIP
jgi:hypothetical protein